jgi:hypothetical protein
MPQESQLAHRVLGTNLPYISNVSPANTDPHYVSGSSDILTSINGYAERRPGFATQIGASTTFHNLQRLFTWDRFDGTFWDIACDINASGFAQVYFMASGGSSFTSLFTDTTAIPFDFVVSNNTMYFSNGNVAKKWDPTNGLSNWGIAIGSVNNVTGPNLAGNGANVASTTVAWTNPNNVTSTVSDATVILTTISGPNSQSQNLNATQFGFSLPTTETITGLQVTFKASVSVTAPNQNFLVQLLKNGTPIGGFKAIVLTTTPTTYTLGSTSDLWGTSWTPTDVNQTTFGVFFVAAQAFSPGPTTFHINNVNVTINGLGGPPVAVSGTGGTFTATAGYTYVFCYGNSNTGHISSPTPPSQSTGIFTNQLNVAVTLTASLDSQVNQIRVFRTTDGGGGTYLELPTSPYPNTSGNITDAAADTSLVVSSVAPITTFNDPPTPFQGMVYFSGRIWGFVGNKVYFSGLEEINQGVPEECFPSGVAGNFWSFDQPVQGLGVAGGVNNQILGILCGGRVYAISGNTLATFQRINVSQRRGTRSRTCVTMLGGMMAWLDSSNQIWATDGNTLQEISIPIRPDLIGINPALCSMTFHTAGRFHWLVFSTGTKLFIYDVDQEQWLPPWNFAAQYIFSGEIGAGNYVLMAATATKALQLSTTAFNDNGSTYAPVLQTNLLSTIPDFGSRFSYIASGIYNEPTRTGVPWTFQITNNGQSMGDVQICVDDDPTQATYTSIAANLQDTAVTYNRNNGTFLKQLVYPTTKPASRWIGLKAILQNADQTDNIYELVMAYKPLSGR